MKAPEQLRRPEHWQNFEELCLKLWGAIWNKPEEIELNSSNSQGQDGVDIYCRVDSENGYVGIQCKNLKEEKLNGKHNNIILSDIEKEITKAERFEPALKRFIIATSAEKDGEIQKSVRIINEERIAQNKFPVEIKFWDYISMKIDEHKSVHDWYVKSQNFKRNQNIKFTFDNDLDEIILSPIFSQEVTFYSLPLPNIESLISIANLAEKLAPIMGMISANRNEAKYNRSYIPLIFNVANTGELPIENWKIKIDIEGDYTDIEFDNKVNGTGTLQIISRNFQPPDVYINKNPFQISSRNDRDFLVSGDNYIFDEVFIKPKSSTKKFIIKLNWVLLSKDFQDTGTLIINVEPKIKKKGTIITVNTEEEIKPIEYGEVEDYISSNSKGDDR